jgi:hypothetical protein
MRPFLEKILRMDRRWIFVLMSFVVVVPVFAPLNLAGLRASANVQKVYSTIEDLPEGSKILISFDFDPSSKPELAPQGFAVLRHCFRKKHKVVAMGLWVTGVTMAKDIVQKTAKESGAKNGEDYVYLGWKPGNFAVIEKMGTDIHGCFPTDGDGKPIGSHRIMESLKKLSDFDLVVSLAAGSPGIDTWIAYGSDKYKFKLTGGTTAVNVPSMAQYVQSGQMIGLIGAMRGAAEYELLIRKAGDATAGMDAISLGHYMIVALILAGNFAFLMTRRAKGAD